MNLFEILDKAACKYNKPPEDSLYQQGDVVGVSFDTMTDLTNSRKVHQCTIKYYWNKEVKYVRSSISFPPSGGIEGFSTYKEALEDAYNNLPHAFIKHIESL